MLKRNFFKQPAKGFDLNSQGRSDEQIAQYQAKLGFKLPATYCDLMRQQNGGEVRYAGIAGTDEFDFYGGFSDWRLERNDRITNFRDYMLLTCDEDELNDAQNELKPFYPERLILFSGLDGHSAACFDYGYRQDDVIAEPSIVFIDDDGDEFLHFRERGPRFASFDEFLANLHMDPQADEASYIGLVCRTDYDATLAQLIAHLSLELTAHQENDRYGHFNFLRWHSGQLPLVLDDETLAAYARENGTTMKDVVAWVESEGRTRKTHCVFSPNQHRSGTWLYQDSPEVNVVLEINKAWFPMQGPLETLMVSLRQMPCVADVMRLP